MISFTSLRTMRMSANHRICAPLYEIAIACDGFRHRNVNILYPIMWQNNQIVHAFLSINNYVVHTQVIDVSATEPVMLRHIIKYSFIGRKKNSQEANFYLPYLNDFHFISLVIGTCAKDFLT